MVKVGTQRFGMKLSFTVVVIFTALDIGLGLDCSKCTHVNIKDVPTILQNIVLPKSPQCASTPAGQTASGVGLVRCPANPSSGQVYRCGSYTGTVTVEVDILVTKVNVNADIVYRDCILMDPAIPTTCTPQSNVPTDNAVLRSVLSGLADVNALTFVGTRCVDDQMSMSSFSRSTAIHKSDMKGVLCIIMFAIIKCFKNV